MNEHVMDWLDILKDVVVPSVTALGGWLFGRRKRKNDFIADLQQSINLLSEKNGELIKKVMDLNEEVIELRRENGELKGEVEALKEQLSGVKTITRVEKK